MEVAATDAELVDRIRSRLGDLIHICKQELGAADDIAADESAGHPQEAPQLPPLARIYRERDQAIERSNQYYAQRMLMPDVPAPRRDHSLSPHLATVDKEPQLTTADYKLLAASHQRQIELDADRRAKSAGHLQRSQFQPVILPRFAEEALEAFYTKYGKPSQGDIFVLCQMLQLSKNDVVAFFIAKLKICAPIIEAKRMLHKKAFMQKLERQGKGKLEEFAKEERENDKNVQVPVEGMD
ncbi:hypothetical protein PRZ48_013651 [Zasmidium cellare]|uniref:Homeobox domain-containing protein n=1 Tax=Zasmidium cellare TaxID=395010 RepID=A0ABR0E1N7_ZASCE|nr:hypothetical protein PRZ48_013651 [Zasmidium cellare]